MTIIAGDFVQVNIDGTDRTDYVISYNRYSSLCEIGDSFNLVLSPDYPVALEPYQPIIITEWYDGASDVVLRGYLVSISQNFEGAHVVAGQDKSIRLFDYFIPTQIKSDGQSVDYWIQWYADQAGLAIDFQATSANSIVEKDTPMGLQSAGQGMMTLERLAAYFIRFDSDQDKLIAYRLGDSNPVITIDDVTEATRTLGTEKTRNKVKVYGGYKYDPDPSVPPVQVIAEASAHIPELLVDKTVVINSPGLRKQTYVDIVADRVLSAVSSIDDLQYYSVPLLLPDLEVGQVAYINVNHPPQVVYNGERKITSIETVVDTGGASTVIGIGEKCARISIEFPVPPVYATTNKDGVAVSWDGGSSWAPSNTGLTGLALSGLNIAANSYGRQMALTENGLYKRYSSQGAWTKISEAALGDPINAANDIPAPSIAGPNNKITLTRVVDEPTNINNFHLMANWLSNPSGLIASGAQYRTWIYSTKNFGSSWTSSGISIRTQDDAAGFWTTSGTPVTSGVEYTSRWNFEGLDIKVPVTNNVYVLGNLNRPTVGSVYWASRDGTGGNWHAGYWDSDGITITGTGFDTVSTGAAGVQLFSVPNNRNIAYAITTRIQSTGSPTWAPIATIIIYRTLDKGKTWAKVYDVYQKDLGGMFAGVPGSWILDPGSLGATMRGVVKLGLSIVWDTGSPWWVGPNQPTTNITYFHGRALVLTDNFGGNLTSGFTNTATHTFITKEEFFGQWTWFTQEEFGPSRWGSSYNLNGSNVFSFGVLAMTGCNPLWNWNDGYEYLIDYDNMYHLAYNVNLQAGTTWVGTRHPFLPPYGWDYEPDIFQKFTELDWGLISVVGRRPNGPSYTYFSGKYIMPEPDLWTEYIYPTGFDRGLVNYGTDVSEASVGVQQYPEVDILGIVSLGSSEYRYINTDGSYSGVIGESPPSSWKYLTFYTEGAHYFIFVKESETVSGVWQYTLEKSQAVKTAISPVLGPLLATEKPANVYITSPGQTDIRTLY